MQGVFRGCRCRVNSATFCAFAREISSFALRLQLQSRKAVISTAASIDKIFFFFIMRPPLFPHDFVVFSLGDRHDQSGHCLLQIILGNTVQIFICFHFFDDINFAGFYNRL